MGSRGGFLQPRPRTRANPIRCCMVWGWMECYLFPGEGGGREEGGGKIHTRTGGSAGRTDRGRMDWVGCPLQTPNSKRAVVGHQLGEGGDCVPIPSKGWLAGSPAASPAIGRGFVRVPTPHTKTRSRWPRRWPRARGLLFPAVSSSGCRGMSKNGQPFPPTSTSTSTSTSRWPLMEQMEPRYPQLDHTQREEASSPAERMEALPSHVPIVSAQRRPLCHRRLCLSGCPRSKQ